ncbi:MAG TPA: hypothetical protein VGB56_02515 [Flavisolibacter sp.]|jgi:hypothetical protein
MSDGFDNMEYKTRYPAGSFPDEGEGVFQHRAVPAAGRDHTEKEGRSFTKNHQHEAGNAGRVKTIGPGSRRLIRLGSAIGALLLIIYSGSKAYQVYMLSPEQLYSETFQPYVLRTSGSTDTVGARFEAFYRQGSMDSIIRAARKKVILSEKETLIAGLAYLTADDPFWAIRQLKKIARPGGTTYAPEADFYLALAYLKNRDYDHALTLMLAIRRQRNHPYRDKFPPRFLDRVKLLKWR